MTTALVALGLIIIAGALIALGGWPVVAIFAGIAIILVSANCNF
jgi:hypothetical protein